MKRAINLILSVLLCLLLTSCSQDIPSAQIAATTLPVFEFTERLCAGTGLQVIQVISREISCLHDYTLQINQMIAMENAQVLIVSGAGLEEGLLPGNLHTQVIDASEGIPLLCKEPEDAHDHGHHHHEDPHIWLSISNAKQMAENICISLSDRYPEQTEVFESNLTGLLCDLDRLQQTALQELSTLKCRKLVTFHDGFSYMAQEWGLELLHSMEEESGSEASAKELIQLSELVHSNELPAIFTEKNGSVSAAQIIAAETGARVYSLDMAMSGKSYFDAMYCNIRTLKEALG